MTTIAIVDYGMGNLCSVEQALRCVCPDDTRLVVTDDGRAIADADKVVFPGQGAAGDCIKALNARKLAEPLTRAATEKPFLGICMGMQVLLERSEENGGTPCLGLVGGEVRYLGVDAAAAPDRKTSHHKIPHIGWNQVQQTRAHPLWDGIADGSWFYFVHSYYVQPGNGSLCAGRTEYCREFTCALASGHIFAVQFHPEKSADCGLHLLRNFTHWDGSV